MNPPKKSNRLPIVLAVLLTGIVTAALAGYWFWPRPEFSDDPDVAEVQKLLLQTAEKIRQPPDTSNEPDDASLKRRFTKFREVRAAAKKLSPQQQAEFRESSVVQQARRAMGSHFREMFDQQAQQYMALPESERTAFLDKNIDRMESWRKNRRGGRPSNGSQTRPRRLRQPDKTQERRESRRKRILDDTDPEQRARWSEYITALRERRQERGLGSWHDRR